MAHRWTSRSASYGKSLTACTSESLRPTDNRNRHETVMARIDQESAERQATQQAVDAQRRHDERRSARIDARGLPLIGLGIVMTGIPDGLARWAWVGLIFVVAAALLVIVLALWAFGRWVASRISPPPEPE